jgi:serine/threonine protein kinase
VSIIKDVDIEVIEIINNAFSSKYHIIRKLVEDKEVYLCSNDEGLLVSLKFSQKNFSNKTHLDLLLNKKIQNISTLLDYYEFDDMWITVSEYINGIPLNEYVENYGNLRESEALSIVKKLSITLYNFHNTFSGIVFRDLQPKNIILDSHLNPFIIDSITSRQFEKEKILILFN